MKKLLCYILVAILVTGIVPTVNAAYNDLDESNNYYESALRLQDLGIISGYDDGTFRPSDNITRAEFTKVVVCMMDKEAEAKALSSLPAFSDVERGNWATAYISYAVSKDILSGYADGTFGPTKNISFSEALTILLRTIGYKEDAVGYFWPDNYIDAALSMEISSGLNYAPGDAITRGDAAILVDRTLFAKPSSSLEGGSGKDTYLESLGYTVLDDALILDNDGANNNISVLSGNVKTGSASTYVGRMQTDVSAGEVYKHAVIDKDGYLAAVNGYSETSEETKCEIGTVTRLTGSTIEYTGTDGRKGTYKANDDFTVYYNSNKMTFSNAKNYITGGTEITFFGKEYGLWNVAVLGGADDIDPVLASRNYSDDDAVMEGITVNKENLIVYRNGNRASLGEIEANDVVYYNQKTNTMDVYSKKVSGIYYDAIPSKAYVESVSVGGKEYEIGYTAATSKLDASVGAFEIGDKITLILGKNDKVVFVTDSTGSVDYFSYGVVLSSALQTSESGKNEGNTEFITEIFMTDGETHKIETNKLYTDYIGDFVRISYTGEKATLTTVSRQGSLSKYVGKIDVENRMMGDKYVLKDVAIIQKVSDDNAAVAECELLDFDKLTVTNIDEGHIINMVTANTFGDVAILYVKNLEKSYTYGVVTGYEKSNDSVTGYKIFADGKVSQYSASNVGKINTQVGAGVGFNAENTNLKKLVSLVKVDKSGDIDAVEGGRIMLNGKIYKLASEVFIADITSTVNIRNVTIDELSGFDDIVSVVLYSDKAVENGGLIRVITVKTN